MASSLANRVGVHPVHLSRILNGKRYASPELAVKIEKATGGKIKVEDIVRPEVAEALKEYIRLRCPMLTDYGNGEGKESAKANSEVTVG